MSTNLIANTKALIALMRLDKPIGSFLLLWPTLWALWIAAEGVPNFRILLVFILGVITMRSAGCVINDIADRDFDGAVQRTANRPLVIGTVTTRSAMVLFAGLCLIALLLVIQLNLATIKLSAIGLLLATIYPFTKRVTYLPQLVLGAAFAWSVPMVFVALNNSLTEITGLLFVIAALWPVAYDSIYALMDRDDDLKAGIKSTAILFGNWDAVIIFLLQLLVLLGLLLIGLWLQFNLFYYGSVCIAFFMICYQVLLILKRTSEGYYRAFYNNHWLGLVIFIGIFLNYRFT